MKDIAKIDFWYIFLLTIYFGGSTSAFMGLYHFSNWFSVLVPLTYTLIIFNKYKVSFSKDFFRAISIVIIWLGLQYVLNSYFNIVDSAFYIYNIVIAYILITVYGTRFFGIFERVMYVLSIISLIGWTITIAGGGNILLSIAPFEGNRIIDASYGVYSVRVSYSSTDAVYYSLIRNCGFCSEPGHFAAFVGIAIFINLVINNFSLKGNKHLMILLATMLSTQSTTGYLILSIVIVPFFFLNYKGKINKFWIFTTAALSIFLVINSSIVSQKIADTRSTDEGLSELVDKLDKNQVGVVAQRFDSFMIELENFSHDYLIGYGKYLYSYFYNNVSNYLVPSNGCASVFAKHGAFMGIIYFILLFNSSILISRIWGYKGKYFIALLICCFLFSYDHQTRNYILFFVLYSLFAPDKRILYSQPFGFSNASASNG